MDFRFRFLFTFSLLVSVIFVFHFRLHSFDFARQKLDNCSQEIALLTSMTPVSAEKNNL